MAAVALYCLPANFTTLARTWLTNHQKNPEHAQLIETAKWKVAGPYMLITSQWQLWNLFSPEPLRNVLYYDMERWDPVKKNWKIVFSVTPSRVPFWRAARDQKVLYSATSNWDEYIPLRKQLLKNECIRQRMPVGTDLRLVFWSFTIPGDPDIASAAFWKDYKPELVRHPDVSIRCHTDS